MKRRSRRSEPVDDRTWSAHTNIDPGADGADIVASTPLPAETGPMRAPDRLSVWPLEGGQYGIDAHGAVWIALEGFLGRPLPSAG